MRLSYRLLLFLFVLAVVGPLIHTYADQQASRVALTAAIWDNHSVQLDGLEHTIGQDAAFREGHFYSDKAPLQPVVGVPFYAMYRAIGGEPASVLRIDYNLNLWWQTFWLAAIPLALLAVVLARFGERIGSEVALPAALALTFGTILLPFGGLLFGHTLAALFIAGAVFLVTGAVPSPAALAGAGALAGAAVATEYPVALAVIVIAVVVLWQAKGKTIWFLLGGLPFAAFLAWYHNLAFGSPLSHPYRFNVFHGIVESENSFFSEFSGPHVDNLVRILFSGRGFLIASPIVILGIGGLIRQILRDTGFQRRLAILSLSMFTAMLLVPLFWGNPWGGASPGPRYLTAALPVLVVGVVAAWGWRPLVTRYVVAVSVLTMVLATLTDPLILPGEQGGIGTWIGLATKGRFADTVFTMAMGSWGWIVHGALVATIGWLLFRSWRHERQLSGVGG